MKGIISRKKNQIVHHQNKGLSPRSQIIPLPPSSLDMWKFGQLFPTKKKRWNGARGAPTKMTVAFQTPHKTALQIRGSYSVLRNWLISTYPPFFISKAEEDREITSSFVRLLF